MSMTVLVVSETCHTLCFFTRIVGHFVFNFVIPVRILSDGQHLVRQEAIIDDMKGASDVEPQNPQNSTAHTVFLEVTMNIS